MPGPDKTMAKRKLLISLAGVTAFIGLGAWALLRGQGGMSYRTVPVERGAIAYSVSATGSPNAVVTVQVGSQVSGNIMALYADFNTHVTKGQLVARIDPQIFQARVDQALASVNAAHAAVVNANATVQKAVAGVASANSNLADAKAKVLQAKVAMDDGKVKMDRRIQLAAEGVLSREDRDTAQATYDSAVAAYQASQAQQQAAQDNVGAAQAELEVSRTQVSSAQAQVKQAQASLAQAQADLDHTYISAPVDGMVVARQVDVGQTVAASLQAPTLFQIAQDLAKMQVDTNVSEADVGRVAVGQPATFTVDAYPGTVFRGAVREIRKAPINVQNVITYDVVVAVRNPDLKLFPGMTANVKILVDRREDVLKVPNAALRFRPPAASRKRPRQRTQRERRAARWSGCSTRTGRPGRCSVTTGLSDGNIHRNRLRRPEGRRPCDHGRAYQEGRSGERPPGGFHAADRADAAEWGSSHGNHN